MRKEMNDEMSADTGIENEPGVFLTLDDCKVLFSRLKAKESFLSKQERIVLLKMEKVLYGNLSVREMEEILGRECGPFAKGSSNA